MLYPDDAPNREETQNLAIKPLVTFGILTDVQYADIDDGMSYDKTRKRYYRNSLNLVKEAIANWKQHETENQCKIKFILQLGDIIDLQAKLKNETDISLDRVITELNRLFPSDQSATTEVKLMHIWGNHEMYNYKRDVLSTGILNTSLALGQNSLANTNCYTYDVTDKLRLICLDFYRFSILGYDETHTDYKNALALIQTHNKNEDLNQSHGLRGHALRFCKFNGNFNFKIC
jgi:manganese-dependent ADP-ribose/CDP-alcohol diphosphatase